MLFCADDVDGRTNDDDNEDDGHGARITDHQTKFEQTKLFDQITNRRNDWIRMVRSVSRKMGN